MPQSVPQVPAVASGVGRCRTTEKRVFDGQVEKMESKPAKSLELEREESEPLIYSKLPIGCLLRTQRNHIGFIYASVSGSCDKG